MTAIPTSSAPSLAPDARVRLRSADCFNTLVAYEVGDVGVTLRSCDLTGLWWVAFDRDPHDAVRLPAAALELVSDHESVARPSQTALAQAGDALLMIDSLADLDDVMSTLPHEKLHSALDVAEHAAPAPQQHPEASRPSDSQAAPRRSIDRIMQAMRHHD